MPRHRAGRPASAPLLGVLGVVAVAGLAALGGCSDGKSSSGAGAAATSTPDTGSSGLTGVYRAEIDSQRMIEAGVSADAAVQNSGVVTLTLTGSTLRVSGLPGPGADCTGTYTATGHRLAIALDNIHCSGDGQMTFTLTDGALKLSDFTPADDVLDRVFWTGQPWQRTA